MQDNSFQHFAVSDLNANIFLILLWCRQCTFKLPCCDRMVPRFFQLSQQILVFLRLFYFLHSLYGLVELQNLLPRTILIHLLFLFRPHQVLLCHIYVFIYFYFFSNFICFIIFPFSWFFSSVSFCSAGVGRSGTFIVIEAQIERINRKQNVNVYGYLKNIRSQRNFLVQQEASLILD